MTTTALPGLFALKSSTGISYFLSGIPVFEPAPNDGRNSRDESDDLNYLPIYAGGRPDYVPPWELRKIESQLFHVDGIKREQPLSFDEEAIDEYVQVPYSFAPPTPARVNGEALIAVTGIMVDWSYLRSCLVILYSIPLNKRISLSLERNEPRLKCAAGEN